MTRPEKLNDSLWYKLDDIFKTPKAIISVIFRRYGAFYFIISPLIMSTAKNRCLSSLFASYAKDILDEKIYDAVLAGFSYGISVATGGVKLFASGYSDKIAVLLQRLVEELVSIKVEEKRFDVIKADVSGTFFVFLVPSRIG